MILPSSLVVSQGWGLIDLPLRASNEGLLRPRVARAQKIIRLHSLLCSASRRTTRLPVPSFFSILLEAEDIEDSNAHEYAVIGKRSEGMAFHKRKKGCDHNPSNDERHEHSNPKRQIVVWLEDVS